MNLSDSGIYIRPYQKNDRACLMKIAYDTAFMGDSAEVFFEDECVLSDFLTLYFTDYESESIFVADKDGRAVGYIIGAQDAKKLNKVFVLKILPLLILKVLLRGTFLKKKAARFIFNSIISSLKKEFVAPDLSKEFPAVLHINIDKDYRHSNIGRELINVFLKYLANKGVKGVHLSTMSENGKSFFEKMWFSLVHQAKRTYFRNILGKEIICYSMVKPFV